MNNIVIFSWMFTYLIFMLVIVIIVVVCAVRFVCRDIVIVNIGNSQTCVRRFMHLWSYYAHPLNTVYDTDCVVSNLSATSCSYCNECSQNVHLLIVLQSRAKSHLFCLIIFIIILIFIVVIIIVIIGGQLVVFTSWKTTVGIYHVIIITMESSLQVI